MPWKNPFKSIAYKINAGLWEKWLFWSIAAAYLPLAIYFCHERLYGDAAPYLLRLINFKAFYLEHYRPSILPLQAFVLVGVYAGLSLKHLILLFSVGEWCYFLINGIMLKQLFKSYNVPLLMYLLLLFAVNYNYFNLVSELILALPCYFYIIYFTIKEHKKSIDIFITTALVLFLIFSHPLYFFILSLTFVLFWVQKATSNRLFLYQTGIVLVTLGIKYLFSDSYERNPFAEEQARENGLVKLFKYDYLYYFKHFFNYYLGLLILCITVLIQSVKKFKATGWVFIGFFVAYLLLLTYKYGFLVGKNNEPVERYMFPLFIVGILGIMTQSKYIYKKFIWITPLLAMFHFYQLIARGNAVAIRNSRVRMAISNLNQFDSNFGIYNLKNINPMDNESYWIVTIESLLFSAEKNKNDIKQIVIRETTDSAYLKSLEQSAIIYYPFGPWMLGYADLNKNYLMPKENKNYTLANTTINIDSLPHDFFNKIAVTARSEQLQLKNKIIQIPISIQNKNAEKLCSYDTYKSNPVLLSYHWHKAGKMVTWDGLRTPLLTDVKTKTTQLIAIKTPSVSGCYELEIDMLIENKKWLNIAKNRTLINIW